MYVYSGVFGVYGKNGYTKRELREHNIIIYTFIIHLISSLLYFPIPGGATCLRHRIRHRLQNVYLRMRIHKNWGEGIKWYCRGIYTGRKVIFPYCMKSEGIDPISYTFPTLCRKFGSILCRIDAG